MLLDFRHETFLALSHIQNYTKAAKALNITQPAVTQHIQYLENHYGCKLFAYQNRKISLTPQGEKLKIFVTTVMADGKMFENFLLEEENKEKEITFGATLSIGEYVMPHLLSQILLKNPMMKIHMSVGNTQTLLEKLYQGDIAFALVEGIFDKSLFGYQLFSLERFIPVSSAKSVFGQKKTSLEEVLEAPLILREKGSGTREILENVLNQHNYTINSFKTLIEIGNMAAIKKLVIQEVGISFLYEVAAKEEIIKEELKEIEIENSQWKREFNFVYLKNSFHKETYHHWFETFYQIYHQERQ